MQMRTSIPLSRSTATIDHLSPILLLGSCFAENIGKKLCSAKFDVDINPFGTLYNPFSVANALALLMQNKRIDLSDLFEYKGIWHSWMHHSRFSDEDNQRVINHINNRLEQAALILPRCQWLVITWGTAYVYKHKVLDTVVSNCHQLPANTFDRYSLSVNDIVEQWSDLIDRLVAVNSNCKLLFTVSPIRHLADGAHQNQLSKATLLLAVEELQKRFPDKVYYFAAYEIMMDDLRDYRFYADDMCHPSSLAIDYIYEVFSETFFSPSTFQLLREWKKVYDDLHHIPRHPQSDTYRRFLMRNIVNLEHLSQKFPYFDISKEIEDTQQKINHL